MSSQSHVLEEAWSRYWTNFIFVFLLFKMLKECISNDLIKFESWSLSNNQDTGLTILCHKMKN